MKCSFCERDAVAKCSSRACKALICDQHGTHNGQTSIHGTGVCRAYHHILCDKCYGINTSKGAFGLSEPAPQVARTSPLQIDWWKSILSAQDGGLAPESGKASAPTPMREATPRQEKSE